MKILIFDDIKNIDKSSKKRIKKFFSNIIIYKSTTYNTIGI